MTTVPAPPPGGRKRDHVRRNYETEQIVVHWDSSRCIHSANCLQGLPQVFDVRRRPWVRVDSATADEIAATVDTCPSRALTYARLDGAPLGPNGVAASDDPETADTDASTAPTSPPAPQPSEAPTEVVVSLKPDGPLIVEGPIRVELARGEVIALTEKAVLCRCGSSANKPFCDGSHKRIGFRAEGW